MQTPENQWQIPKLSPAFLVKTQFSFRNTIVTGDLSPLTQGRLLCSPFSPFWLWDSCTLVLSGNCSIPFSWLFPKQQFHSPWEKCVLYFERDTFLWSTEVTGARCFHCKIKYLVSGIVSLARELGQAGSKGMNTAILLRAFFSSLYPSNTKRYLTAVPGFDRCTRYCR